MAGDWIKMRGGLFQSPKLIAMGRRLHECREFRDWMTPGGAGPMNGQIVSDHALRCVTGALLTVTWSWSREFGKRLPDGDCLLPHIAISDMDGIAGAPGVGEAMQSVGWAIEAEDGSGVILPKFFVEHNVPLTPAEKQRDYRQRKKEGGSVTKALPEDGNKTVTREEKRREEKSNKDRIRTSWTRSVIDNVLGCARENFRGEPFPEKFKPADKRDLLKIAAVHCSGCLPENWLMSSLDAIRNRADPKNVRDSVALFKTILRDKWPAEAAERYGTMDQALAAIEIPDECLKRKDTA